MLNTSHRRGLRYIAAFKLFKGLALLALGIGALKLLHKDVAEVAAHWLDHMRVDPDNRFIHRLLEKLSLLDDRKLKELSAGTFFYSALLLTEGVGLWLAKRWAEYLTIIATSSLIPLELYALAERVSFTRIAFLLINIAVVAYLWNDVHPRRHGR